VLNLAEILQEFVIYRQEVILRRTKYDKKKAEERAHILEGFHLALENIDAVIKTIKTSEDRSDAHKKLMKKFKLSDIQANAILDMRLASLAKLERQKIKDELKSLKAKIKELEAIIKSPKKVKQVLKKELEEVKKDFGDERRTKVLAKKVGEITQEDLIPQEPTVVILTRGGFVKRLKPSVYRVQKRGGKGVIGAKTKEEDIVEHLVFANTLDDLFFFTDSGKVFQLQAHEIPETTRITKGKSILNFLEISSDEKILAVLPLAKTEKEAKSHFIMATKNGVVKKTAIEEFDNVRRNGLIAIRLKKGDLLTTTRKTSKGEDILLITKKGKAIRFKESDVRSMGRSAAGVKGIRLASEDEVIAMEIVEKAKEKGDKELFVISENGYGKRTPLTKYRVQKRGGTGIKTAQITSKTGNLVAARSLSGSEDYLIVISEKAQVIMIEIKGISKMGRATQGVRIIKLDKGDKVASIACVSDDNETK
jgi:DNA gyrase subunit A